MATKSPPAGLERQISSMREKLYNLCLLGLWKPHGFWPAKQGYYIDSYFQDSQINRHETGTTWHYLTKSTLLTVWSPALAGVGWLTHAMSHPHRTASLGTAFLLLPNAATFQSSHWYSKGRRLALILKAISNYFASRLPLFSVTCALLAPTSVESFQQPLPFERALQTAIYTLNRH